MLVLHSHYFAPSSMSQRSQELKVIKRKWSAVSPGKLVDFFQSNNSVKKRTVREQYKAEDGKENIRRRLRENKGRTCYGR